MSLPRSLGLLPFPTGWRPLWARGAAIPETQYLPHRPPMHHECIRWRQVIPERVSPKTAGTPTELAFDKHALPLMALHTNTPACTRCVSSAALRENQDHGARDYQTLIDRIQRPTPSP